jgi:thiol-disulfide isomerase/thioredoxin
LPPFEEVARFRCWFWSPAPRARSSAPAQPRVGAGQVVDGSQVPVVVKFFAKWCRKCMAMGPKYKKIAAGYGGRATFVKIEIEEAGHLAKKESGVVAIPTFQVSSRPPTHPPAARARGEWLDTRTCRPPQVWKGRAVTDKYVAGSVISKVPGELCEMIDRNLDCGFSLVSEISEDLKQARPVPRTQRSQLPSRCSSAQPLSDLLYPHGGPGPQEKWHSVGGSGSAGVPCSALPVLCSPLLARRR